MTRKGAIQESISEESAASIEESNDDVGGLPLDLATGDLWWQFTCERSPCQTSRSPVAL
ncbi:MAG: hypothetical protein M0Z85_08235 [Gammaproteobacteria bacterium]|nr:hypothetical protein [Gammaproteobacteria bacterium]